MLVISDTYPIINLWQIGAKITNIAPEGSFVGSKIVYIMNVVRTGYICPTQHYIKQII